MAAPALTGQPIAAVVPPAARTASHSVGTRIIDASVSHRGSATGST